MHDKHDKYCLSFSFLLSFFSVARLRAAVLLSVAHGDSGDRVVFPNVLKRNGGGQERFAVFTWTARSSGPLGKPQSVSQSVADTAVCMDLSS